MNFKRTPTVEASLIYGVALILGVLLYAAIAGWQAQGLGHFLVDAGHQQQIGMFRGDHRHGGQIGGGLNAIGHHGVRHRNQRTAFDAFDALAAHHCDDAVAGQFKALIECGQYGGGLHWCLY